MAFIELQTCRIRHKWNEKATDQNAFTEKMSVCTSEIMYVERQGDERSHHVTLTSERISIRFGRHKNVSDMKSVQKNELYGNFECEERVIALHQSNDILLT